MSPALVVGRRRLPDLTHQKACCDMALARALHCMVSQGRVTRQAWELVNRHQGVMTVTSAIYRQHTCPGSQVGTVGKARAEVGSPPLSPA